MTNKAISKKLNKFRTSPLIPVIAIIEVIILVCVCTYAWFVFASNKTVSSGTIAVEPDSGLDIDFNNATDKDFINIKDYLNDFSFKPATSIDGRNIYFPTSGTFNSTNTNDMIFRDGTVNDINSGYISIDFSLTNTSANDMKVGLSDKSYFTVNDPEGSKGSGKALRLAFYENDGTSGNVRAGAENENNMVTVYFHNTRGWATPYVHVWKAGPPDEALAPFPGTPMVSLGNDIYSLSFSNEYDHVLFSNGNSSNQTIDLSINPNCLYTFSEKRNGTNALYDYSIEEYSVAQPGGSLSDNGFPVISPGVSVGFTRPYIPVTEIGALGEASKTRAAYASSFDDYIYTATSPGLFSIAPNETVSLTMIVWLEGTDANCTEDSYAGSNIDMNFIFATNSDNADPKYTYYVYDRTKENWTADQLTSLGVTYNPVIQLYDQDTDRGYLMTREDYNDNGVTINRWTCEAPQSLVDSEHDILFRRVNPNNEDQVWNYWDAGPIASENVSSSTVSFTIFADGAPTSYYTGAGQSERTASDITKSCGGTWGNLTTSIVTVFDGTSGQFMKNDQGVLAIKYTINGKTIEYKASGPNMGGEYDFVVPDVIKNNSNVPLTIRRYYYYGGGAFNSLEENPNLTYHKEWSVPYCQGQYLQIGQNMGESVSNASNIYWGSDVLYVQSLSVLNSKMDSTFLQVHFYYGTSTDNENDKYVAIYKNGSYKSDSDAASYGYCCVIPNDRIYQNYRVERCNSTNSSDKYNITPKQAITSTTSSGVITNSVVNNICQIEYIYLDVYFQLTTSLCGSNWDPECYVFKNGGAILTAWPGYSMSWVKDVGGYKKYHMIVDVSRYDRVIFSNEHSSASNGRPESSAITVGADSDVSGMIFQGTWSGGNSGSISTTKLAVTEDGVNAKETLHCALYNSPDWK